MFHDFAFAAVGRDGKAAADNFPHHSEVGIDLENALRTAVGEAETGDHFVEDQKRFFFFCDGTQAFEKAWSGRDHSHICGYRLDNHSRNLSGILFEDFFDAFQIVIGSIQREAGEGVGNAGRRGDAERGKSRSPLRKGNCRSVRDSSLQI